MPTAPPSGLPARRNFTETRCNACHRLLFRWRTDSARAYLDCKCTRCGTLQMIAVGTTAAA